MTLIRISELEHISKEISQTEKQWGQRLKKENRTNKQTKKTEESIQGLWDNYKRCNIPVW